MSTKTPLTKEPVAFKDVFAEMSQRMGYDIGELRSALENLLLVAPKVLMGGDVSEAELSHYQKWNANFGDAFERAGLPWDMVIDAVIDMRNEVVDWDKLVLPAPPRPFSVRMVQMVGFGARGERVVYGNNDIKPEVVHGTNLEDVYVNWVAGKQRVLMKRGIIEAELQIWNEDHPVSQWGLRFEPRLVITGVRPPLKIDDVDLTNRDHATQFLEGAVNEVDWDAKVDEIKKAHGGQYPEWWLEGVLTSGLASRMRDRWK